MTHDTHKARPLLNALARWLHAEGLARYQATGAYPPGALPAVTFYLLPTQPDAAVAVTVYDEVTDRDDDNPDVYVQFRWRTAGADARTTDDAADALFDALHDATHLLLPDGARVLLARRVGRGPTVPDSNRRFERADNYRLTMNPPATGGES